MIFASRTERTIPIPDDPPHTVTIRKLAGRHLEQARQEQQIQAIAFVRRLGGAAAFARELSSLGSADTTAAAVQASQADPRQRYDRLTVLRHGVKGWTYDDPVTPDALEDLTEEVASWLSGEILRLTLPTETGAEDEKKSLSISTAP